MSSVVAMRPPDVTTPLLAGRLPSTPANYVSPLRRRRGPLENTHSSTRSPMVVGVHCAVLEINDDEAEKRDRRLSKMLEMQQRNLVSPATPAERRQSLPLSGLSNAQLAEHYADCIKLSTENKISAKNAFGLHLIDYMSDLFKKKEVTDFQLASSTLDASAKIYAGRVDAIHSEMYKVLSGLGRGANNSQKPDDDQEGIDDRKDDDTGDAMAEDVEKKRKRARKSQTVETNLKNITMGKFDLDSEVDPTLQKIPVMSDEGGTSCLLLNQLRCFGDTSEVILDFSTIVTSESNDSCRDQMQDDACEYKPLDVRPLADICSSASFDSLPICTAFADFEFMNWTSGSNSEDVIKTTMDRLGQNVHVFDLDAEPEPIPDEVNAAADTSNGDGDIIDDGFGPVDDNYDDDDDEMKSNAQRTAFASGQGKESELLETAIANIRNGEVGSLIQVLASEPSDYSYFKTDLMRTWAGPEHWKLQPKTKVETTAANEKTKKSKTKEPFKVTFDDQTDFEWNFKVTKAATTVTKMTLDKHSKQQTTLPDDLHYDAKQLLKLFTMPSVMVKWQLNNAAVIEVDKYNYDNANDKINFCPGVQDGNDFGGADDNGDDDDVDNDDNEAGGIDFNLTAGDDITRSQFPSSQFSESSQADGTFFTGDNLVAVPRKIAKIDIDYAKVAKRIDVKRLKTTMWDIITENCSSNVAKVVASPVASSHPAPEERVTFKHILGEVTTRVSSVMAKNLSVPIVFVCLLHLANEKTLKISNSDNMTDLLIEQGER